MESTDEAGTMEVLRSYTRVLVGMAAGVSNLFYLTGAIIAGWITALSFLLLGSTPATVAISMASFAVTFLLSGYVDFFLTRLARADWLRRIPQERRAKFAKEWSTTARWIGAAWAIGLAAGLMAGFWVSLTDVSSAIPVAVSSSVGVATILVYAARRFVGAPDVRIFILGAYLIATLPIYPLVPSIASVPRFDLEYMVFTVNLSIAFFGSAFAYVFGARRQAAEVLHAARG